MKVGDQFKVSSPIDRFPHGIVPVGTFVSIDSIQILPEIVFLKLETDTVKGFEYWENVIQWERGLDGNIEDVLQPLGFIDLSSIGVGVDPDTFMSYPQLVKGGYDLESGGTFLFDSEYDEEEVLQNMSDEDKILFEELKQKYNKTKP